MLAKMAEKPTVKEICSWRNGIRNGSWLAAGSSKASVAVNESLHQLAISSMSSKMNENANTGFSSSKTY